MLVYSERQIRKSRNTGDCLGDKLNSQVFHFDRFSHVI